MALAIVAYVRKKFGVVNKTNNDNDLQCFLCDLYKINFNDMQRERNIVQVKSVQTKKLNSSSGKKKANKIKSHHFIKIAPKNEPVITSLNEQFPKINFSNLTNITSVPIASNNLDQIISTSK